MSKITEFKSTKFDLEFKPFTDVNIIAGSNGDGHYHLYAEIIDHARSRSELYYQLPHGHVSDDLLHKTNKETTTFIKDKYGLEKHDIGFTELNSIFYPLLYDGKQDIVFLSYPETLLGIRIQFKLIEDVLKVVPDAQLFIVTHSPAIFGEGWASKIVNNDVLKLRK